jgi:hypothetical protein
VGPLCVDEGAVQRAARADVPWGLPALCNRPPWTSTATSTSTAELATCRSAQPFAQLHRIWPDLVMGLAPMGCVAQLRAAPTAHTARVLACWPTRISGCTCRRASNACRARCGAVGLWGWPQGCELLNAALGPGTVPPELLESVAEEMLERGAAGQGCLGACVRVALAARRGSSWRS